MYALMNKLATLGLFAGGLGNTFGDLADELTAVGSTQADAYESNTALLRFTTVAAGTGVKLDNGSKGDCQLVVNDGANSLVVYPHSGGQLESLATNEGVSLAPGTGAVFYRATSARWFMLPAGGQSAFGLNWVNVRQYGAFGNGVKDDTTAINTAIIIAALTSRIVYLPAGTYLTSGTINVPAGVVLMGDGRGNIVNTTPTTGSIIRYTGAGTAVSLNGTLAGLERLAVVGTSAAAIGVLVNGDGNAVESWYTRQLTIYGFTGGVGMKLQGINAGAVAYGHCSDLRIRHAKTGLYITDTGGGAGFCNTNQFFGGGINGVGFDYGIRADGGNDNIFYGVSIEPPSSTFGHLVLEADAAVVLDNCRVEAVSQAVSTPTITVGASAKLKMTGLYGGTLIRDDSGRAEIDVTSSKVAMTAGVPKNALRNASFSGVDVVGLTIPEWTISTTGSAPTFTVGTPELGENAYVLRVDVPATSTVLFGPTTVTHDSGHITFGAYIKTSEAGKALARIAAPGVAASSTHPGDGLWHSIGMSRSDASGTATCRISLDNSAGGATATFYITTPFYAPSSVAFDKVPVFSGNGGFMAGTIEANSANVTLPAAGSNSFYTAATSELTIPKWGNTIHVTGTARTIARINNLAATRWAKGTQLRLVFDIGGVVITDGAFVDLRYGFTSPTPLSAVGRGWLLLESNGDGTWQEIERFDGDSVADYTALRAYAGPRNRLNVAGYSAAAAPSGIAGTFVLDDTDVTTADNGGTVIVAANGKRWKRVFDGQINVRWFGAKGDGLTNDTAAIQAAINYAETFTEGKNPAVYIPAGEYVVASTITVTEDGMKITGDGIGSWLRPTITNGTACLKMAAGCGQWFVDGIRIEATLASEANYISGAANAQACIGFEAYQTGSNFITRYHIGFLRIKNCATGIKLGGFIGTVEDLLAINCELGMDATLLNDVSGIFRFENCRKSYAVTDSNRLGMTVLDEGTAANTVASTIDGGGGIKIEAYLEWDAANRTTPFLTIGGTTEVSDFVFGGSVGGSGVGVYQLKLDRVNGATVGGNWNLGTREGSVETTANTKGFRWVGTLTPGSALQDASKQLGVAHNYFPNSNFDMWFRGWANVAPTRLTISQETTIVRKGANAVRLTCTAGQNSNYCLWQLTGDAVTQLRGKTVVLGMWIFVPDQAAFDNTAPTALPGPVVQSFNGVTLVTSTANNNRCIRNAWNFVMAEVTIQTDATFIYCEAHANQSGTNAAGTEYIVVDSMVLCEKSTPVNRIYNGDLIDSPAIAAIGIGGRMIASGTAAPTDTDQVYAQGDEVRNSAMAVGSPKGWACTVGGSPGTWVSEGNL